MYAIIRIFSIDSQINARRVQQLETRDTLPNATSNPSRYTSPCDRRALRSFQLLSFDLLNIRTLNSKVEEILTIFRERHVGVMMLVETWRDRDSVSLRHLRSNDFLVVDRPRPRLRVTLSTNHGGLAVVSTSRVHITNLS